METSLHRELKNLYADEDSQVEVKLGSYRIDVLKDDVCIEIQASSLSAFRDKIKALVKKHKVLIVKPLIVTKTLVKKDEKGGEILSSRKSPKKGSIFDLFDEMVHFTNVFPHKNLTLEVALVDVEEHRFPGHGRRRRKRENDYQTEDILLTQIHEIHRFKTAHDLTGIIPVKSLPSPFHTGDLAKLLEISPPIARQIAYCLRETGAIKQVGKSGNSLLYKIKRTVRRTKKRSKKLKNRTAA